MAGYLVEKELRGLVDNSLTPDAQAKVILDYLAKLGLVPELIDEKTIPNDNT